MNEDDEISYEPIFLETADDDELPTMIIDEYGNQIDERELKAKAKEKPKKMHEIVIDGNKIYHLTEEEMEKYVGVMTGATSQEEFDEILKGKKYGIAMRKKDPRRD